MKNFAVDYIEGGGRHRRIRRNFVFIFKLELEKISSLGVKEPKTAQQAVLFTLASFGSAACGDTHLVSTGG